MNCKHTSIIDSNDSLLRTAMKLVPMKVLNFFRYLLVLEFHIHGESMLPNKNH